MNRRNFIKQTIMTSSVVIAKYKPCFSMNIPLQETSSYKTYKDKAIGCWLGAAIADAMGGPVECQHCKRISREFPDFEDFLP